MKRAALVAIAFFLLFPSGLYARVDTRVLVNRAVRAWNAENYREALDLFTRAHETEPGQAVYVWGMARCHEKLGQLNRALVLFREVLGMQIPQPRRAEAEKKARDVLALLTARTKLRVTAPAGFRITVDGRAMAGNSMQVAPGTHRVVARRKGFEPCRKSVIVGLGREKTVKCTARPVLNKPAPMVHETKPVTLVTRVKRPVQSRKVLKRTLFWSGVAVGVAGIGMHIWGAVQGRDLDGTYSQARDRQDAAKTKYYIAGGLYVISAGLVLAGLLIPDHAKGVISVIPVQGGAVFGYTTEF